MKHKFIILALLLVSSTLSFVLLVPKATSTKLLDPNSAVASPDIIWVPDNYTKIQWAIDNASDGDIIQVRVGIYYEHITVNKSVALIGENKYNTVIDGNNTGNVISITANKVNISSFTIQKGAPSYGSGISMEDSSGNNISYNVITHSEIGISLVCSSDNTVSSNNFSNNAHGLWIWYSNNNVFADNIVSLNTMHGIYLWYSNNNILNNNSVSPNYEAGILIGHSNNNSLSGNNISNNSHGCAFLSSNDNVLTNNIVSSNNYSGIWLSDSSNNTIFHNNFINNTEQVHHFGSFISENMWDNDEGEGNYWSDYNGTDLNQDGIGDTPYLIDENNTDNYPLMGMFCDFAVTQEFGQIYHVQVISNSTILNLDLAWWLSSPTKYLSPGSEFIWLNLNVTDEEGFGFCRIMIPRAVLNDSYIVLVDNNEVTVKELPISNSTHAYLYFTYFNDAHEVIIVPEFPLAMILPLLMILTLTMTMLGKKFRLTK